MAVSTPASGIDAGASEATVSVLDDAAGTVAALVATAATSPAGVTALDPALVKGVSAEYSATT